MQSLLANTQLFNGCNTVFTTTSTSVTGKLDKAERDSRGSVLLTCLRELKPERYGRDISAVCYVGGRNEIHWHCVFM